ncbi:MAG TPA: adenosylcobinamide-GDP ribazoletransferase [Aquabacterium sp.]|uniref:adenosylcobinamide-GDP ribazoletransferase n=1 Tax=Aquabacterium sp. TaxID=1872578 RepID=UPI002E379392|nr:adenosylcobinamide-GDP ribazoletransferase [Aquabacterium sp.]HEX5356940.1 adenosylcobinamide-GDP ribazoletransferase [Aquabacterium sp.]
MKALLHELRLMLIALQFLTRVPVPAWVGFEPAWLQGCMRYFPLIGALVGLAGALVLAATAFWWPPLVAVVLSMAFTVWLTGGFHEDGLADTCDALGGSVSRDRALTIMKDSRIGSYGSLGLILVLMLKASVLASLASPLFNELDSAESSHVRQVLLAWTMMAMIWCHAASRLVPVCLTRVLPYAGDLDHAKAKPLAMQVSWANVSAAWLVTGLVAGAMVFWWSYTAWPVGTLLSALLKSSVVMLLGAAVCARWFNKRLGGFTGDTLGASQQLTEVMGLLAWLAVVHPVA